MMPSTLHPERTATAIAACVVLSAFFFVGAFRVFAASEVERPDLRATAEQVHSSVVHISGYMGQETDEPYGKATGFLVDQNGLVVSILDAFTDPNTHLMCEHYRIRLWDGAEVAARIYSADSVLNLALLKTDEALRLPVIPIERGVRITPGESVVAVSGKASGDAVSYYVGYVKAKQKNAVYSTGFGDMLINTQMQLPPEASGGPLLNAGGELIGVNTNDVHTRRSEGVDAEEAHALPAGVVQIFLKASKAYPTSEHRWIGISVRQLTPDEKDRAYKTLGERVGLYVDFVWDAGPAGDSDIRAGDILVKIDGVGMKDSYQFSKMLQKARAGDLAELFILRGPQGFVRRVAIQERPAWAGYVQ